MSLITQQSTRQRSLFGLQNDCATAGSYEILHFLQGVAAIPRAASMELVTFYNISAVRSAAVPHETMLQCARNHFPEAAKTP